MVVGISNDTNDMEPSRILDFPIFDYQGGNKYMQGGTTFEENKSIEIGLDLTPLLNEISSGEIAKVFFQLVEKDPNNIGTGELAHFSIIDYTNGVNEINCTSSNVPIVENGTTTLSITHLFNFYTISIDNEELPAATLYQPFNYQLSASAGNAPYNWSLVMNYSESDYDDGFIEFDDEILTPDNPEDGFVAKQLDFDFPLYGQNFNTVFVSTDGFIYFDPGQYPWPYITDDLMYLKDLKLVAAFLCENLEIANNGNDGIWYQGDENSASFRWKASFTGQNGNACYVNVAVRLFPSGKIELAYGDNNVPLGQRWISGVSNGDLDNYQVSLVSNLPEPAPDHVIEFSPPQFVHEIEISDGGILQGVPQNAYGPGEITVKVMDNNNISTIKTFDFNTDGVIMDYLIDAGGDEIIEASEIVNLNFTVRNTNSFQVNEVSFKLSSSDPYINITDSINYLGTLNPEDEIVLPNAFGFNVAANIPNEHPIHFVAKITGTEGSWERGFTSVAYSAIVKVSDHFIEDGANGSLSSNETANLIMELKNNGMAKANTIEIAIDTDDPNITINTNIANLSALAIDSTSLLSFNITSGEFVPFEYQTWINYTITLGNGFPVSGSFPIKINYNVEDFESNGTNYFPWYNSALNPWEIDDSIVMGGNYSLRSAAIDNNQESSIFIIFDVLEDGQLSFAKKVSCENSPMHNTDYLEFIINTNQAGRWDGQTEWTNQSFDVDEGINLFKWVYHKNETVSSYQDRAWIDNIIFPKLGYIVGFGSENQVENNTNWMLAYPNPFSRMVHVSFNVKDAGNYQLNIYSLNGEKVISLLTNNYLSHGNYAYNWNGQNTNGILVPNGIYYCVVQTDTYRLTKKLVLLR